MQISTDRATVEEKAQAWDKMMGAAGEQPMAPTAAWVWLRNAVEAREAAERVAGDEALAVETENVVQFQGGGSQRLTGGASCGARLPPVDRLGESCAEAHTFTAG